jgi:hypothetical protein
VIDIKRSATLGDTSPLPHKMETVPIEIVAHIASCLSIRDLKSFRLCCKVFSEIGQNNLFSDFDFRLWPSSHRLYQLEQLSSHPEIASKLRCLCFESGVPLEYADYRYWQANVYNDIKSEWERTHLATKGTRDVEYNQFHTHLQARFTPDMANRYRLYRWHLDQQAALMAGTNAVKSLAKSIAALSNYNKTLKFKTVMVEPQITLEDLEQFDPSMYQHEYPEDPDPRRRVANRRHHCLRHYVNFLKAPRLANIQITDLTATNIPHEFLTYTLAYGPLDATFANLRAIDIKIGALPHSDWLSRGDMQPIYSQGRNSAARRLRMLLNNPLNLEILRLEFPEFKEAEYSFEIFDRTNLDRFPRLFLPRLESFELYRFRCSWEDLQFFLTGAKSLSSLKLAYCRLETGSMIDLLHFVPQMNLQSVAIQGRWYVDEDAGEWHAHTADDFTADCFAATSYEGPYVWNGMKAKVEKFMLAGGECPLPRWTPQGKEGDIWEMKGDTSWHFLPGIPRQY